MAAIAIAIAAAAATVFRPAAPSIGSKLARRAIWPWPGLAVRIEGPKRNWLRAGARGRRKRRRATVVTGRAGRRLDWDPA